MHNNNNFDFLRFIFALFIVIAHSYPLSGNNVNMQWIYMFTSGQIELSNIGLNGFFVLSGYLVFQSLQRSKTLINYYWKRFLRLFPALIIVLILTVLLGVFVYNGFTPYFKNKEVYTYFFRNISLYNLQYSISGVFENNAYPQSINGSLWTICYEFTMYILLSVLFFLRKNIKLTQVLIFLSFVCMYACYVFFLETLQSISILNINGLHFINLGTFFVCGSLFSSLQIETIKFKRSLFYFSLLILIISLYFNFYNELKHIILTLIILLVGLKPLPFFRSFGKVGDMSYGMYIYGFPIQQTLMYCFNFSTISLMFYSIITSMLFGYLSWHLVEKVALRYKKIKIFNETDN